MKQQIKRLIGERRKKELLYRRARCCEALGIRRYSWPGWNGLDRRLVEYLGFRRNGIFIEAGANDGYAQSNTYYLQRYLGWNGVLVEPVPDLADLCRRFRPTANVQQVVLGDPQSEGRELLLHVSDLTTSVAAEADAAQSRMTVSVPCKTLSSVVREAGLCRIDLLTLDVEGYELSVLSGLDASMPRPHHVLVETSQPAAVGRLLVESHVLHARMSHHDYLFVAR